MPKSKRAKPISLTQTDSKGRERKERCVDEVRGHVDSYARVYAFRWANLRTAALQDARARMKAHSRFVLGRARVLQVALGRDREEAYEKNLEKVAAKLEGQCGLLFTNAEHEDIMEFFTSFSEESFARGGQEATETVVLPKGPMPQFQHTMENMFRSELHLNTELKDGVIHLREDTTVSTRGKPLTAEAAKLVKLLGYKMSTFTLEPRCVWHKKGSKFQEL